MKVNRYLIVLAVGLFIGYAGRSFFGSNEKQPAAKIVNEDESPVAVHPEPVKKQTFFVRQIEPQFEQMGRHNPPVVGDQLPPEVPTKVETLRLNDVVLTAIENNWSDLRNQAEAAVEENGWRVHLLKTDTVFEMAGIRDGDLIRKNSLEMAQQKSENGKLLANRMAAILDHIAR